MIGAAALGVGCGGLTFSPVEDPTPLVTSPAATSTPSPTPPPPRLSFTQQSSSQECQGCHYDQYEQWRSPYGQPPVEVIGADSPTLGSLHALAWIDARYQEAWVDNGSAAICQRCHIPASVFQLSSSSGVYAPLSRGLQATNLSEGVTCVSCHLDTEGVIRGPTGPTQVGLAPHALIADGIYREAELCEACHNDEVYGAFTRTVDQWREQTDGRQVCQDCHMAPGARTHTWTGGHDARRLADALDYTLLPPDSSGRWRLHVTNIGAGHSVPTGDVYRAFWLDLSISSEAGTPLGTWTWQISQPVVLEGILHELDGPVPRLLPLAAGQSVELPLPLLEQGAWRAELSVSYYLTKPCQLQNELTGQVDTVEPSPSTPVESRTWLIDVF